jgi:hypothetical protein
MAANLDQFLRAVPTQAGHRHAVDVAAGRECGGVEVGVRIKPQHPQLFAHSRQWRATALMEPMPRQWSPPSMMGRRPACSSAYTASCSNLVPGDHFGQVAKAVDGVQPGVGGAAQVAAVAHVQTELRHRLWRPATRRASGPMRAPRLPAPTSVGTPIRLTPWAAVTHVAQGRIVFQRESRPSRTR